MIELPIVLVADDPLVRRGLAASLTDEIEVVRAVGTDADVAVVVATTEAVAVLWDAADDAPSAHQLACGVPAVVLVNDTASAESAVQARAAGVLLRDVDPEGLSAALVAVQSQLRVVDARLDGLLHGSALSGEEPLEPLTPREEEVLELLAEGRSNREIAVALQISPHTSKFHVDRILAKLDASGRTDAVVRAVRLGVLRL